MAACRQAASAGYRAANAATHHVFGVVLRLLVVVYFLFCAVVLGLRYLVLPNIDSYKPYVERAATGALGNPVSIGDIDASWSGLRPQLSLDNVVVHDSSGKPALTLPQVAATVSWWSLVRADLRLHQLKVQSPDLNVMRDADGRLHVAGLILDTGGRGDGKAVEWALSQREIVIRDGRLRWTDHQRGAPELLLENVDFTLRSRWLNHHFALKATPPAAFAAPLDVRARFSHTPFARRSDIGTWKGELYADLRNADLAAWHDYIDYPAEVQRGKGSVRAWLTFDHAKVTDLTADLRLSDVSARLRTDLDPLNLALLSGRITAREELPRGAGSSDGWLSFGKKGHSITLTDFTVRTDDGLVLPPTTIRERYTGSNGGRAPETSVAADSLDLHTLARFAVRLPLPLEQRRLLEDLAPRGTVEDFSAEWQGRFPEISTYRIEGAFSGLSLRPLPAAPATVANPKTPEPKAESNANSARPAIPGFENLDGRIKATDHGGSIDIESEGMKLSLRGYSTRPEVPFAHLAVHASWTVEKNRQLLIDLQKLDFESEGTVGSLSGKHRMPIGTDAAASPGVIDVRGELSRLDLQKIDQYLPLQTPGHLRKWLVGAVTDGVASDVQFKLKGNLADFPFNEKEKGRKEQGEFSVTANIKDATLNYEPAEFAQNGDPLWPVIDDINGSIAFDRGRVEVNATSATTLGTGVSRARAIIADVWQEQPLLTVEGKAAGPLQNFVRFTETSPVGGWIGGFTDGIRASGDAQLDLKLQLPLRRPRDAKVKGTLHFAGNTITLQDALPPLSGTTGKLAFTEDGFSIDNIRSHFVGGPVVLSGGSRGNGPIQVRATGRVSAEGIRETYLASSSGQGAQRIAGSAAYRADILVKDGRRNITVESDLVGFALDFPAPLHKNADDALPLKVELKDRPTQEPNLARDEITLSLGSAVAARYERERIAGKGNDWRVVSGGIGVNVPPPQPDSGVIANVSLRSLNLDAWQQAIGSLVSSAPQQSGNGQQGGSLLAQYIEPEVLAARAVELIVMDRKLDDVVFGASHQNGVWQANIDSRQASGYITWVEPRSGRGLGRVTARLASLTIPRSAASEVTDLLEGENETDRMPALDIVVEEFTLFDKQLGRLELAAQNERGDNGWAWRINKLQIANADGNLRATGSWAREGGTRMSRLSYVLDIADAGGLLSRFGFANTVRGGEGTMEGDISWKGMPFSFDIPTLSGNMRLNVTDGQFLKVDQGAQGAAKLLGVLNLQSLPRRLALDFRDVFSEGFAFDSVVSQATIAKGVVRTDNFKMRGVSATVLIDGTADIAREEQDLHVVVIPEINAGAASVVYALAVNPVIGVGTFLAQLFLREPLMKAFTFEYQITGPWADPVVTRLETAPPEVSDNSEAAN